MKGKIFSLCFLLLLAATSKLYAQGAYIYGLNIVQPGSTEYYEASFDYPLNPYTYIYWSVSGGTIVSQSTNPSGTVYCYIQWDNTPGQGTIDIYEDIGGMSGHRDISIGEPAYPGFLSTNSAYFNHQSPPIVIQDPASGGGCNGSYSYTWELSSDNVTWSYIGSGENYPSNVPPFEGRTFIRRMVECAGFTAYTNVLEFNYRSVSWDNRNYIRINDIAYPGKTTFLQADNLPIGQKQQKTVYYDGLGRPEQHVEMGIGAGNKDIVTPVEYDVMGREARKYLPYGASTGDGRFKTDAFTAQQSFMNAAYPGESTFFSETKFAENSPLNRPTKQLPPGLNWGGNNVGTSTAYELNTGADAVRIWAIDAFSASALPVSGSGDVYDPYTLFKTITTDEAGKMVIEYRDMNDRVILKKQQSDNNPGAAHGGWLCTYNVYDDFGRLRFVIPPKAVKDRDDALDWTISQDLANGLCYRYVYDRKGRMIEKKLPDADPVHMVYDRRDRLIFSQDGNQRDGKTNSFNMKEWTFFVYDAQNRQLASGVMLDDGALYTRQDLQTIADGSLMNTTNQTITIQTDVSESLQAYNPVPLFGGMGVIIEYFQISVNTVNYYDQSNAGGFTSVAMGYPSNVENIQAQIASKRNLGMQTATKVRVLDGTPNKFLSSTLIYDDNGRVLQTTSVNYTGSTIRTTNQYDFTGKLRSSVATDSKTTSSTEYDHHTIISKYEYDQADRLYRLFKNVGRVYRHPQVPQERQLSSGDKLVVENTYDALGQLSIKTYAPGYAGPNGNWMEKLHYEYNLRNWITGINKNYLSSSVKDGYFFGMELGYDKPGNAGFANTSLSGNIAGMAWKTAGDNVPRRFDYSYDNANRLTSAQFRQRNDFLSSNNWTNNLMDFSVPSIQFDANGNITRMEQQGVNFGGIVPMDRLSYGYASLSNKLEWVAEDAGSTNYKLHDFTDKNTGSNNIDYTYDKNANVIEDKNKGISSVKYNYIGLPELITFDNNRGTVRYIYDGAGNKLQKIVSDNTVSVNPPLVTTTNYAGHLTRTGNNAFIGFEEGRIRYARNIINPEPTGFAFDYFVKDHLGNVRMVLTDDPEFLNGYPVATMETANSGVEDKYYRITNRTGKPVEIQGNAQIDERYGQMMSKLSSLSGNDKIGPSILMKVMSGDIVHAESDYYYKDDGVQTNSGSFLNDLVTNLLSHLNGGQAGHTAKQEAATITSNVQGDNLVGILINEQNTDYNTAPNDERPKAYLNYILFDEQFKAVGKGFRQVLNNGPLQAPLVITDIDVDKNGWIYVFVSNESQQAVYFDNFRVIHSRGNLLEETHYYPFGSTMQAISPRALSINPVNKTKYNGKELQNEEFADGSGLEDYDFGARMYDPQIGRWKTPDPLAAKYSQWSPYTGMGNNPILLYDADGNEPIPWNTKPRQPWQWYYTRSGFSYDVATFHSAAIYNTKNERASAYQNIGQRHAYYGWADKQLAKSGVRWFGAAEIVTRRNAVGGADGFNLWNLDAKSEKFLKDGNKFLFNFNLANANALINTGKLTGSFTNPKGDQIAFDGKTGKDLDYAMVQFEQTKVQEFITQYQKSMGLVNYEAVINKINGSFDSQFAPNAIQQVLQKYFNTSKGQDAFNFANYDHRVTLGYGIVDILHMKK
jgi:RHS repeat-associated protein